MSDPGTCATTLGDYVAAAARYLSGAGPVPYLDRAAGNGEDWESSLAQVTAAATPRTRGVVLTVPGPLSVVAGFLATATGRIVRVDDRLRVDEDTDVVCVPLDRADDNLLFTLLDRDWEGPHGGDARPRRSASLLTGRDLAAASRFAARIVAARRARQEAEVFRHFAPDDEGAERSELRLGDGDPVVTRQRLRGSDLVSAYTAPADVSVFRTHGSEACANGADGVVLCGRHHDVSSADPERGVLSCALGHGCARGPHPVPVRDMAARVVMLGTCNGLRLADSLNQPEFSFALAALDSPAVGYVSSAFTSSGGDLAALAFPAALACGSTVGEATALINAILQWSGVERAAYVALGDSALRLRRPPPESSDVVVGTLPATLDLGHEPVSHIVVEDSSLAQAAGRGFTVTVVRAVEHDDPVFVFQHLEPRPHGPVLRLVVCGFPRPPGTVRLEVLESAAVVSALKRRIETLDRWIELWRLSRLDQTQAETYTELTMQRDQLRDQVAGAVAVLRLGGAGTSGRIDRLSHVADRLVDVAQRQVVDELGPKLGGSFWLPNVFAPVQRLASVEESRCPSCGGRASERLMRHALGSDREARRLGVCARCGIYHDIPAPSAIRAIAVEVPGVVKAGSRIDAVVRVDLDAESTIGIHPRLCAHGHAVPPPTPIDRTVLGAGPVEARFNFDLPRGVLPHRHYVKVLVTCDDGLSFACRPLFVAPPGDAPRQLPLVAARGPS